MSTEKGIQQLREEIAANYKDQIAILRSIVASDNRIIEVYKAKDESSEKYITSLKEQVFELQQQISRVL